MVDDLKPILFAENSTVFTSNGIGRLADALDCVVTEERNGAYELEMTYPMSGQHYEDIAIRKIVVVKPSANATLQAFRIYKLGKPINGKVKVYAQHISYDLSKNTCMPFSVSASSSACNTVLQGLKSNAVESCPFTFWTNVTTVASYSQIIPASIRQRLGGIEGSVLDQFGGEYEWDNYTVKLHRQRGAERDITLRYGKNITDIQQEENISETITGVVPYWVNVDGTDSRTLPEKAVYSNHASAYSTHLTAPLDLSQEWEEKPTEVQLRTAAQVYVNRSGFGIPKVSVQVSFVNLADTEEYKDILPLENVNLCDIIKVQFEKLGIDTTAEIVKTTYDVLKEKYISVEIGELRSNFASTIKQLDADTALAISNTGKTVFAQAGSAAQDAVNNATAWLTGSNGYVVAIKNPDGSWKELLFMDDNDVTTAHNVLRINENGLGFSSNGVGGPYTQAWTLDGRLVIGGTNVPSITVYDNNNNIIFQASAAGAQFNNGIITLRDANSNLIFQASAAGVIWNAANSSMTADGTLTAKNVDLNGNMTTSLQKTSSGMTYNQITKLKGGQILFSDDYERTEINGGTISARPYRRIGESGVWHGLNIETQNGSMVISSSERLECTSEDYALFASNNDDVIIRALNGTITIQAPDIYLSGEVHYTN